MTADGLGMKFPKASQKVIEAFRAAMPGPPAQERKMFGYPAAFVHGNMFMGVFGDQIILRLPDHHRESLLRLDGAKPFEPMPGRVMKEYVVLPSPMLLEPAKLKLWVTESVAFALTLPSKAGSRKKAAAKPRR